MSKYNNIEKQKQELANAGGTTDYGVGVAFLASIIFATALYYINFS